MRGPRSWMVGVPETVTVEAVGHGESFPVQVSLLSYPDKKMTYDSQQLQLSPSNRHRGSTSLLINAEDFPSGDEDEQFVYLVAESDGLIKEEKLPVTDQRRSLPTPETKQGVKKRSRRSHTFFEEMLLQFQKPKMKTCCTNGYKHYEQKWECLHGFKAKETEGTALCAKAFLHCCLKLKNKSEKTWSVVPRLIEMISICLTGPISWTVGVPQVIPVKSSGSCNENYTISLVSYPDKNITYDLQNIQLSSSNQYQGNVTLLMKHEDMPRGGMEKVAFLVIENDKAEVLLVEHHSGVEVSGSWKHRKYDNQAWKEQQNYFDAGRHLKEVEDILSQFFIPQDNLTEAWQNLSSYTEARRDQEKTHKVWRAFVNSTATWRNAMAKVKAWGGLQRKITALAGKYNGTEAEECWDGCWRYFQYWHCPWWWITEQQLEDIPGGKAHWEGCIHTREHLRELVAAGHVTLPNQELCLFQYNCIEINRYI
ncbi:uncharacterized protein [Hyperolius riggenbachi]